ncbi:hypothetical protein DSBG_0959 [Desulfosporosinus sp. BG]|nr:hypothetical protein DSBG_0959 [Desulfosporosinus sp. BG]
MSVGQSLDLFLCGWEINHFIHKPLDHVRWDNLASKGN